MANAALQNLFTLFQAGRHAEMAAQARTLLVHSPQDGELWKALSVAQQMLGEDALPALERAMALRPGDAELAGNLGALLASRGRWPEAKAAYERALGLQPRLAGAHNNLGNALLALGAPAQALAAFETALALQPALAAAFGNRGRALLALGRHADAARAFEQAIAAQPRDAGLRAHAAIAWAAAGQAGAAVAQLREAVVLAPTEAAHRFTLGNLLLQTGDAAGAAEAWEALLILDAGHAEAACNLAQLWPQRAEAVLGAALAAGLTGERRATVLASLGGFWLQQGRHGKAVDACRGAVDETPASPQALSNLAQALKHAGRLDEADTVLGRLIALEPALPGARSDRLLLRAYRQGHAGEAAALRAEAQAFGQAVAAPAVARPARAPGPLRVGLVSADLRSHPVGRLAEAWLPALARRCELFVYANHGSDDALTQRLRTAAPRWLEVTGWEDAALAERIAADGIDVLVDLNGHTGGHRLGVFARRPAPRQLSWLGYAGSTGLAEMDGFIGDRWLLPLGSEAGFVETLLRLPESFTVYAPPAEAPAVSVRAGPVCFGCFNALHKLGDEVLALWARVLQAVPDSRLLLKAPGLQHEAGRAALLARWPGDPGRLELQGPGPLADYFAAFGQVDIALDPFPYSGGMTTLDGLWMGVPVLTLPGAAPISRQGLSWLQTLGLAGDWVAVDEDDYLRLAVRRAGDRTGLATLRGGLRQRMTASPLCDADRFAEAWLALVQA
ncbi:putative O-linked N-acetylglucosamine transferase (SPINDLY family) [Pelomonas saccharophila]|uniref:protein O-GlcNAc transferase n=1 Tax=Roseateles saccharophilus TaxID=304 RepID=A0ABU1YK28_ROSSA|nr:tetratricopeptide repeat protein [Roseateles saccharophilus]MDR7269217.1 putative O-linked N-acetylglucosamine transferase (SPINDLY family) [Roseateles saccharophilus]